jgi:hypothetical protein
MVTQVRFESRKVRLELLIGARGAAANGHDTHHARDQDGHHGQEGHDEEEGHRARLWDHFRSLAADERIAALRKLATGSKQDALDALWLTTRLNAGIPTGVAARANGANGLRPPLLLWYDSAKHGQRRYYKGIGKTLQPEFTSEKPHARVFDDLDHAFSVMALCKRAGYSHVTLRRPGGS